MSSEQKAGLLLLGVLAVAVALLSPYVRLGGRSPSNGPGDIIWRAGYPAGHQRICQPADIAGGPLLGPHPLYSRPPRCGHHRTGLIDHGWDWIINPPSEMSVP
jgi:hypothetical protein